MKRFSKILCVALADEDQELAIDCAMSLAQSNQATITVFDVIESSYADVLVSENVDFERHRVRMQTNRLKELVSNHTSQVETDVKVDFGIPYLEIIREVLRGDYDLVVKHAKSIDWLDRMIGSEDMRLLRKCPCPIWLIKSKAPMEFRSVIAAIDLDDSC